MKNVVNKVLVCLLLLSCYGAIAQQVISGIVTDSNGDPIPAVSVVVQGTAYGVSTDFDGQYSLDSQFGESLIFSYLGFQTQVIEINSANINITLYESTSQLDEVVVIGYGSVSKKEATGAVAVLSEGDFNSGKIVSSDELLVGKVAGLVITNNGGNPDSAPNIRIRGGASLNASNNPLIVIDGVPLDIVSPAGVSNPFTENKANNPQLYLYYPMGIDFGRGAADANTLFVTNYGRLEITMLDPADCGPACISLSQDVQGEVFDYPEEFFKERVHSIRRPRPDDYQIKKAAEAIKSSKNPIIISGGGVFYSDAMDELSDFAKKHNVPVTQTVMGYSTMKRDHSHFLGPIGGLGGKAANNMAKKTDLAIAVGTKLADFTTGSWANFENPNFKLVSINAARFDANKHMAQAVVGDAKVSLSELSLVLGSWKAEDSWNKKAQSELKSWNEYVDKESGPTNQKLPSYAHAVGAIYRNSDPSDIAVTAAGGLVGEVVQVWRPRELNTHETEWGFSCMSYEISGALGIKMANPDKDVIAFVGDGSYLLYNSDIYSSVITNNKLIIIVCDNGGHAVINRLQLYKGGKEFNCLLKSSKTPNLVPVDFASHAKSMGAEGEQVNSISELEEAFKRAKKSKKTYVISIHTDGYQWLEGSAYWESPTLSIPTTKENERALKEHLEGKKKQRKGV